MRPFRTAILAAAANGVLGTGTAQAKPAPVDPARWQVWIEQDGKQTVFEGQVHLKKAPFAFIFRTKPGYRFELASAIDGEEIKAAYDPGPITRVMKRSHVGAEYRDGTERSLSVMGSVSWDDGSFQSWSHDAENESFQQYAVGANGYVFARREIDTIYLRRTGPPFVDIVKSPVSAFLGQTIYILMIDHLPGGAGYERRADGMGYEDVRMGELVFD